MNRKLLFTMALGLMLLISTLGEIPPGYAQTTNRNREPRYLGEMQTPPPQVQPPTITISSPQNKTYNTNQLNLIFKVTEGATGNLTSQDCIVQLNQSSLFYQGDWQENATWISFGSIWYASNPNSGISIPLTNMTDGNHSVTVYASETGYYTSDHFHYSTFTINNSATTTFTVDTITPQLTVLSPQKTNYQTYNIPLNVKVDDPKATITYSLDDNAAIVLIENTTLTELTTGPHSLQVWVNDSAGNVDTSEMFIFNIISPTPTPTPTPSIAPIPSLAPQPKGSSSGFMTQIIYAAAATTAALGIGTSVMYWRKKKHTLNQHTSLGKR